MSSTVLSVNKIGRRDKQKPKKWSKNQFIVWSFNFIVGYGFVITLNGTYQNIGNFLPLILIIAAVIAFVSGYSYVRLSRSFYGDGGVFLYATKNIRNRFIQYSTGFWQYVQGPTIGVASFFGIMWAFNNIFSTKTNLNTSHDIAHYWYISVASGILFGIIFIMLTKGFMMKKYTLYIMYILKWSMLLLAMFIAIANLQHFAQNINNPIGTRAGSGKKINEINVFTGVISFFFAFGGFEGVAVIGNDVENAKKNLGRTLIICLILTILAYIVMWFLLIGSIGTSGPNGKLGFGGVGDFNPLNVLLSHLIKGSNGSIALTGKVSAGMILVLTLLLISEVANKSSSRFMNGGVNSRILVVLSKKGFLPKFFTIKNRNKQYINALGVDFVLIYFIFIIFYIIYLRTQFKLTDVLDLYTILTFLQYIFVFFIAIKFYISTKKRWHKTEVFAYIFVGITLIFFLVIYELVGIINFANSIVKKNESSSDYGVVVIAGTMIIIFFVSILLYFFGYMRKWHLHDHTLLEKINFGYSIKKK